MNLAAISGIRAATTFSALRSPNYRRFWWGGLVSLTGSWGQTTALSWLVYDLTGSPLMLGTVMMVNTIPTMLLALVGGVIADRSEKRHLLLASQGAFMTISVALAILTLTGRIEVWQILAVSVIGGVASAIDMPARQSLIPHLVGRDDLLNAIALNSAMFNGSRILGPAIAGFVIGQLGPRAGPGACFAINSITYLAVLGALATIRVNSRPPTGVRQRVLREVREGVAFAWQHHALRRFLGLLAVTGVFGLSFTVLMPVFARDVLRVSAQGFGMLMTASGLGATIGVLVLASSRPRNPGSVILGTQAAFVVLLAAFALSSHYALSLALMVVLSGAMTSYLSSTNTTIQSIVPDGLRGRVMSIYILAFFGTAPLGGLLMGSLASALGAPVAALSGAIVCAAGTLVIWLAGRRQSALPSPGCDPRGADYEPSPF